MDIKKRKFQGDGWRFGKKRQRKKTIKVTPLKSPHSSRLKTSIHPVQSPFWAGSKEEELQGDRKEVKKRVVSTTTCPCGSCGTGGIGGTGAACPRQQASLLRQQATWRGGLSYSTPDYTVSRGIVLSNHRQVETQNSITTCRYTIQCSSTAAVASARLTQLSPKCRCPQYEIMNITKQTTKLISTKISSRSPPDLNGSGGLYYLAVGWNIPKNKKSRDF